MSETNRRKFERLEKRAAKIIFGARYQQAVAYPRGGMGGSGPPHFSKSWSSRFTQKCNKIGWGGGGVGQICQEVVSEILEKQAKNGFEGLVARFWLLRNA